MIVIFDLLDSQWRKSNEKYIYTFGSYKPIYCLETIGSYKKVL